jgi:archaemetzincin
LRIAILRIGTVDRAVIQIVRNGLPKVFPTTVCTVLEEIMPIPQGAYSSTRKQYDSSRILVRMSDFVEDREAERVLGITDVDLHVPNLNFVFGEAECPGRFAIISLSRLKPEFFGQPPNRTLFHERSVKEAVHEIGHTLGLHHCRNPKCVMFFSNSLLDTDHKEADFCERCYSQVVKHISAS